MIASIPKLRVKRLNPDFSRRHHLGPRTKPQAIARIERDAELSRSKQIAMGVKR